MIDPTAAIEAQGLSKRYGVKLAVDGLDLTVQRGEVFGFLGPNGAGKTTTLKMLLGLASPTSGQAWLLGQPVGDPASRRRVGFLPEHFRFHEWMTAVEFLDLHGRLHRVPRVVRRERIPELLELVGMTRASGQRLATFSKGMLQRIGLAQALINAPEVVFLDEPTSGLDPLGRRMVRGVIARLREQGTTVFLNSHLLSEVEVTCSRVAFITGGRVRHVARLDDYEANLLQVVLRVGQHVHQGVHACHCRPPGQAGVRATGTRVTRVHRHGSGRTRRFAVQREIFCARVQAVINRSTFWHE